MNYIRIDSDDLLNGEGIRVVLWVSGCERHCRNCHNPETWNCNAGQLFTEKAEKEIYKKLKQKHISGITLTGGHPLEPYNLMECTALCKNIKKLFPKKDIWVYTGFTWEEVKNLEIMQYIDVLVDGEYNDELRNIQLKYRGSANQRIIDVQASLKEKRIIIYID
ncbi:MAG: anaerobic ribonucleoside-triphosphate reductase activating protein [Clostridia bacterium]|nr:anaerobic ribonucleoside-triphosphate reductase activating protein [Clostridia bacterium]